MEAMQALRSLIVTAHQKIHKNRFKDKTVDGKWEAHAHDEEGRRTWKNASPGALLGKLREEVRELEAEVVGKGHSVALRLEAGDVTAMSMMIADQQGALAEVPMVVCLCGSTKFKAEFEQANYEETMRGNIVLSVGSFPHTDIWRPALSPQEKEALDMLHKHKIDLADEILVINVGGYIGDSTRLEIEYATLTGKPIRFISQIGT